MKTEYKHRAAMSFTKKLLVFFIAVAVVLSCVTVYLAFQPDASYEGLSVLSTITVTWFGGTTVFSAFYVWKSKNENRHKYAQAWLRDIGEKYGWEAAARFSDIVLKGD